MGGLILRLYGAIRDLPPSLFAIVMATGIVSLALNGAGFAVLAHVLFWLNVLVYAVLWLFFLARLLWFFAQVQLDLQNHVRAPGYFTVAAGTGVLGNQCVILLGQPALGLGLWVLLLVLWFGLSYALLPGLMEVENKPPFEKAIHGAWLLIVVATQAVSVLSCLLAGHAGGTTAEGLVFLALLCWLVGGMLYVCFIALIIYRFFFVPLAPGDMTPPYWINMGAMAISTLAGASLISNGSRIELLADLLPFVKGMTLLCWATATWWIPLLLSLGVWRHLVKRTPLHYDHGYWAMVFPLGMYTACTQSLIKALNLPALHFLPDVFVWVALAAWCATFAGLLFSFRKPASVKG